MTSPFRTALPVSLLAFALCASLPVRADELPSAVTPELAQAVRSIAGELVDQLGQKLRGTMSSEGPIAAVGVCKETAPAIAKRLSEQHAAQVGRVGTRARNHKTGVPNAWQRDALAEFDARLAQGEKPAALEYWKVVDAGNGQRELHYAKAIITQPLCVSCHGNTEDIPAPLLEKIRAEYPQDQATGYSAGKLRGAVVVTKPM